MRLQPLGSGSRGNATLVEFGATRILVDAGLSARALAARLEAVGVPPRSIAAIVLSHEHEDHARGAEGYSRRHGVPLLCSPETLVALDRAPAHYAAWQPLDGHRGVEVGGVRIECFPVPHDAVHPVGFVLHGEGLRVGIATDLGHATTLVRQRLRGCHVLMVEANHDPDMLRRGTYPWQLKQRVAGRLGHLSNAEAADLLGETVGPECQAVVLAHLSEHNNHAPLARRICAGALARIGRLRLQLRVAVSGRPTPPVVL